MWQVALKSPSSTTTAQCSSQLTFQRHCWRQSFCCFPRQLPGLEEPSICLVTSTKTPFSPWNNADCTSSFRDTKRGKASSLSLPLSWIGKAGISPTLYTPTMGQMPGQGYICMASNPCNNSAEQMTLINSSHYPLGYSFGLWHPHLNKTNSVAL